MFGSIGGPELLLIFVVALLVFGPRKLPELGRMLGKGMAEFRRAANDLRDSLETEVTREQSDHRETKVIAASSAVPTTPAALAKPAAAGTPGQVSTDHHAPDAVAPAMPDAPEASPTAAPTPPDAEPPDRHA